MEGEGGGREGGECARRSGWLKYQPAHLEAEKLATWFALPTVLEDGSVTRIAPLGPPNMSLSRPGVSVDTLETVAEELWRGTG